MLASEILRNALEDLRTYGWIQGQVIEGGFMNENLQTARACSLGAIRRSAGGRRVFDAETKSTYLKFLSPSGHTTYMAAFHALNVTTREQHPDHTDVVSFNDHPDATFADVERVFEKAIVRLEEQGL